MSEPSKPALALGSQGGGTGKGGGCRVIKGLKEEEERSKPAAEARALRPKRPSTSNDRAAH